MAVGYEAQVAPSHVSPIPISGGWQTPVSEQQRRDALQWLTDHPGVRVIGFLLRIDPGLADASSKMPARDPTHDIFLTESAAWQIAAVQSAWLAVTSRASSWSGILRFPSAHSCAIRAPHSLLRRFIESDVFDSPDSPIAGILVSRPVQIPEHKTPHFFARKASFKASDADDNWQRAQEVAASIGDADDGYIRSLDIGIDNIPNVWGSGAGAGQAVCVLDSGADESHPALQRQISLHAFFDSHAQYKEAKYCFDRGCHGTKVTGTIVARPSPRADLGLDGNGVLGLGIAPAARVVMANVLEGECMQERGTDVQVLAGMDWAIRNRDQPKLGGYRVVNISIEPLGTLPPSLEESVDDLLVLAIHHGLLPILPSGNQGSDSATMGTRGWYIGTVDRQGRRWDHCGEKRCHLLAPGVDALCCQPPTEPLGGYLLGCHSGSSFSTAVVSGAIAFLCDATGRDANVVLQTLIDSADRGRIRLDEAYRALR